MCDLPICDLLCIPNYLILSKKVNLIRTPSVAYFSNSHTEAPSRGDSVTTRLVCGTNDTNTALPLVSQDLAAVSNMPPSVTLQEAVEGNHCILGRICW